MQDQKVISKTYFLEQEGKTITSKRKGSEFKGTRIMVCALIKTGLDLAHTTLVFNEE